MTLRVLLAESQAEYALFLREVLTDLDGARCWGDWIRLEVSQAATRSEAAAILASESVDVLVLDPDLADSQGAETFRSFQATSPHVPVVLLVEPGSVALAERMVRDGAQDFLLKKEVDCVPLARAIRNAMERHRLLTATRASAMTDQLTGLLTRPAFLMLADRDRVLAERLGRRMLVLVVESSFNPELDSDRRPRGTQLRDLALVEAADSLRGLAGPAGLLGRLDTSQFGIAVLETEAESIEEIRARLKIAPLGEKIALGVAVFDPQSPVSLDDLLELAAHQARPMAL